MKQILLILSVLMLASCATGGGPGESAQDFVERMNAEHDKALVKEDAPYFTDEMRSDSYRKAFREAMCKEDDAKACTKKLDDAFYARMNLIYFMADGQGVEKRCAAYPVECNKGHQFEEWARKSHNEGVEASRQAKLAQIQAMRAQERSESNYRTGIALQRLADSLAVRQPTSLNATCMTIPIGGVIQTTCH